MSMTAELPPVQQKTADELVAEMKKMPLFMTSMDDMDEDNDMLEAIKALVYEGTRAEVADNFRVQGNDCVKTKQWREARDSYTKALAALKGPQQPLPADAEVVKIDEEAEEKQERTLEEACYANRALCNLEMSISAHTNGYYAPSLTIFAIRELRLLQSRLRGGFADESAECQGVVQSSVCLSSA